MLLGGYDRSHYERFRSYHESFYRFVEPTGATPFSKPARERGLNAILIAMLRQKVGLLNDKDAGVFNIESFKEAIEEIQGFIINRMKGINSRAENQLKDDTEDVLAEMQLVFEEWQSRVDECEAANPELPLYFGRKFMVTPPTEAECRLLRQYNSKGKDTAIETLTSMRNVDAAVTGSIVIWEE